KKALISFARSRWLEIIPDDRGDDLKSRITGSFGLPETGELEDIVRIPLSRGEGYLYTRVPDRSTSSSTSSSDYKRQFVIVFIDIPMSQRTFVVQRIPLKGRLAKTVIKLVLNRIFGAGSVELMEIDERFPDFGRVYNVFTEDVEEAERAVLTPDVMSVLMVHPRKKPANICFAPSGFGVMIEPMMKSAQEIERFVAWSENLARSINDIDEF
ncbi:MAG: hypothetical protein P8Y09_09695, partial [Deltaproteobacteria bacterium]